MMRATFTIAAIAFVCRTLVGAQQEITCESPCECTSAHGKGQWTVKNDPSTPPTNASAIQTVTPSNIFGWAGPNVRLTWQSPHTGIENNWYSLTGRDVAVEIEADGDLHLALRDPTDDKAGIVVCEVPCLPVWCGIRQSVF